MKKTKILVIEDEKDVRNNISTLLEEEGFSVLSAPCGEEGIEIAKKEIPDLIVCDILMTGIDGYEVLKELSKEKKTRSVPFIYLTAKVERDDLRKGMQLGADDYIFKPFKSSELIGAINARLQKREVMKADSIQVPEKKKKNIKMRYEMEDKIFLNTSSQPIIVQVNQIIYITAENQYTSITTLDGRTIILRKSISAWEELLPSKKFLRIHRSTLINSDFIIKMEKWYNASFLIYLKNVKEPFVISKRYSSLLRKNQF